VLLAGQAKAFQPDAGLDRRPTTEGPPTRTATGSAGASDAEKPTKTPAINSTHVARKNSQKTQENSRGMSGYLAPVLEREIAQSKRLDNSGGTGSGLLIRSQKT
jgi:hypothetical protein